MIIRYVISSNVRYESVTLPKLLGSMTDINPFNILVVVGGADEPAEVMRNGVTFLYVQHNSFDYTGLIEIVEREIPSDWWFWLHDTCQCGPRFRELVEGNFDPDKDMTALYATVHGYALCNLGMYRHSLLLQSKDYILSLKGIDKHNACLNEGELYHREPGTKGIYPNSLLYHIGSSQVYRGEVPRLIEYYAAVDLYKFKANWPGKKRPEFITEP
jgi:hypothetical protein